MKINYQLDENNYIIAFWKTPFDETKPFVEVDNLDKVHLRVSQVVDGVFYENKESYEKSVTNCKTRLQLEIQITNLKLELQNTDYKLFKFLEGLISEEDWATIKTQRQQYRDEINRLEAEISALD